MMFYNDTNPSRRGCNLGGHRTVCRMVLEGTRHTKKSTRGKATASWSLLLLPRYMRALR